MTQEIETTRMFGNCPVKGCKQRFVTDTPAFRHYDRDRAQRVVGSYLKPVTKHSGMADPGWWSFFDVYDHLYTDPRHWTGQVADDRPRCPDHNVLFRWRQLDTSKGANPDKRCDGRCRSARGPVCDCPCLGEQHGADNVIKI
ncbi:hypothetical protein HII36_05195 [Nonomuraea sp. NN258]|uniref:hypothetical protein n=1 Tax=Nonomuraea antri TaxID=2730852 RepID=UPI001568DBEC|nr:hypothetical protein [Nonomuraea antri]NRQ31232.1 hypothetical protein [Nonomuraea antri]